MDDDRTEGSKPDSDEGFKFKGAAIRQKRIQDADIPRDTGPEACTICLQPITDRAVATPCNHLTFDFTCLASWLQEQARCPLCKAPVTEVQYDWRGPDDFETFHVPAPVKTAENPPPRPPQTHGRRPGHDPHRRNLPTRDRRTRFRPGNPPPSIEDPALARRRAVYRDRQFSLRVGANRLSAYRDFTPADVAASPALQSRARAFLRRELRVFHFLDDDDEEVGPASDADLGADVRHRRGRGRRVTGKREFVLEYVVALLRTHELKGADGAMEALVGEMVGRANAGLLLHELEAWLRSPYESLGAWDAHVQYARI